MLFTGKFITVRFLNVLECYELMMRGGGGHIYVRRTLELLIFVKKKEMNSNSKQHCSGHVHSTSYSLIEHMRGEFMSYETPRIREAILFKERDGGLSFNKK